MKENNLLLKHIEDLLDTAIESLGWPNDDLLTMVQYNKLEKHGELSTNIAMQFAPIKKQNPVDLAKKIVEFMPHSDWIESMVVLPPGFINFHLSHVAYQEILNEIIQKPTSYGKINFGQHQKILIEFVSANPTGPLHVGHGRGAVVGDVIANLLSYLGFKVEREYYVNDAGRQMDILTLSVWLRYLQQEGVSIKFPNKGYLGGYIVQIAKTLEEDFRMTQNQLLNLETTLDDEKILDQWIEFSKKHLGQKFKIIRKHTLDYLLKDIQEDLEKAGVFFDSFFFESTLFEDGAINQLAQNLEKTDHVYQKEGALWLKTTPTDEKDRVILRANGQSTYFASDILYHLDKFERGYEQIINVWGGDHHGYIARLKAAMKILKQDSTKMNILLIQFVSLAYSTDQVIGQKTNHSNTKSMSMSTRSGNFVSLKELEHWVKKDALRFFYTRQSIDQQMVFDVDLARMQDKDNPVFYIQYACARIYRLFEKSKTMNGQLLSKQHHLTPEEKKLLITLSQFPNIVFSSGTNYQPFQIAHYLEHLASDFHRFYNHHRILDAKELKKNNRLSICRATHIVLSLGLKLLGISVPSKM